MQRIAIVFLLVAATLPLHAATTKQPPEAAIPAAVRQATATLSAEAIRAHVKFLSSDLLEGRGPGTRGDEIASAYMAAQFEAAGLQPAGDDGTYFQKVSLVGIDLDAAKSDLAFMADGRKSLGPLAYRDQFVGGDQTQTTSGTLDSEVVFVGHGVIAPEYKWDDYKGLDTRGKTLVMLVDDPPANSAEPELFKGNARTYYGRWTYKYEIGAAKDAAAVILIHTDEAAGYGWNVVRNSWAREKAYMRLKAGDKSLRFAGWIAESVAKDLFTGAGLDIAALTKAASSRDFRPVPLGFRLKGTLVSIVRPIETTNVVARVPGSDPKLREEAVLYSAHHDHLGVGTADATGDTIYNGALDNATGSALLLELAKVWAETRPAPKRSILFAAVAAEEQGLLGSEWFGLNPAIPAGKIALALNYDGLFQYGRVRDVTMLGVDATTFYPTAKRVARALDLHIVSDLQPEQGSYYRSDHFSLAKVGVPAFSISEGEEVIGKPAGWGRQQGLDYRRNRYHQPSDEFDPSWDFATSLQMGQFGFWLGWEAANSPTMPNWNPGEEFRATRDKSLK